MRIVWNSLDNQFEAELQSGANWQADQEAAKTAGFHCAGPPSWKWYAGKAQVLKKLRENRPPELTITTDALEQFQKMSAQLDANAEVLNKLAEFKKQQKVIEKKAKRERAAAVASGEEKYDADIDGPIPPYWEGKEYITREDLPQEIIDKICRQTKPFYLDPPHLQCVLCNDNVYLYEKQEPPTCLSCEKDLDNLALA